MKPDEFYYLSCAGKPVPPMPDDAEPGTWAVDITCDGQRYMGMVRKAQPEEDEMEKPEDDLCDDCAHRRVCGDYEGRPWRRCDDYLAESPKEIPMPELKPCPIPNCGAKAEYLLEGNARCSDHDCPLGRAGTWIPVAAWQALPRPEKGEEKPAPEERRCETCWFFSSVRACDGCESNSAWRPNRPGDEARIREIVEDASGAQSTLRCNPKEAMGAVVSAGQDLAWLLKVDYCFALRARMSEATARLGPWDVHDGRDYRREALEELLDAACYLAAERVREEK